MSTINNWRTVPLGKVCRVIPGYAFKSKDWCDEGIPVIKIKNVQSDRTVNTDDADCVPESIYSDRLKKFLLEDGDILLAMTGATAGKVGKLRTKRPMLLNQRVAKIKPVEADADFIWALISSDEYQSKFFNLADGAAQPNMSGGQIEGLELRLPDLPTQRKIAGILSAYDDLIENNLRRIKILEEMAQSLYREWFVHFRFPGHESAEFVDSVIGPIPKGWEVGKLQDVLVLQRGFDLPKAEREVGDIPIYAASGITGYHSESKVKGPGIVTGRSGTIGQVIYIHEDFWPLNTALWVKAFPRSEPLYAYFVLSGIDLKGFNSGAAVPTLNRNDIHSLETLIPPIALQRRFHENAGAMLAQARVLTLSKQNLRRTRDLLLPKLLSADK